jgi:hypothetical protein
MLTQTDHGDIGTLIGFALQPTLRPGSRTEYRRTLDRYRTEPELRDATVAILQGLGARVLSDGGMGLVLGVESDSPFAFRYADMPNTGTRDGRLLAGLVLVGLAAFAYPTPGDLLDDRVRRIPEIEFEEWLRATCEVLRQRDAGGEVIPDDGLDEAWRTYVNLPSTQIGSHGRGSGRLSPKCTLYWVHNGFTWLAEQGMARPDNFAAGGAWTVTERFRSHVADMASERAYTFLAELGRNPDRQTSSSSDLTEDSA